METRDPNHVADWDGMLQQGVHKLLEAGQAMGIQD